jgi:hypothetical protein
MFGLGAAFLAYSAATPHRGLVILQLIRLDRDEATLYYTGFAIGCAVLTAMLAWNAVRLAGGKQRIEIDDAGITVPARPFRLVPRRIAWAHINRARLRKVSHETLLEITDGAGTARVTKSYLDDREFDEIVGIVAQNVPGPRAELPAARIHG